MTPEDLEFYKLLFQSPIVATIAGGILGACATGFIALRQARHNSEENKKAWERQEISRKKERIFEKKAKTYEDFFESFDSLLNMDRKNFCEKIAPICFRLALYGTPEIKENARKIYNLYGEIEKYKTRDDFIKKRNKIFVKIRDSMIADIQNHFSKEDTSLKK